MQANRAVWVVDDDDSIRWVLERALSKSDYAVNSFSNSSDARAALTRSRPDVVISDIRMPGGSGLEFLDDFRAQHPTIPVIIITAHSDLDSTVSAYDGGAFDYLPKPFDIDEVLSATARACEWRDAQSRPAPLSAHPTSNTEIIGAAPSMQAVFRAVGRLARANMTVLISGETGSGKELVARALHTHSPRAAQPFVAINVAAIPHELIESDLFGHEKGAFTGAHSLHRGRFEQANGGTLFLDEIGDMPVELQTRLLRVLADGQFYRVGGHAPVSTDVRIITATHRDLEDRVALGQFREDLFHRLNVVRVQVPPLRERREDIPALLQHFLSRAAIELGTEAKHPSAAAVTHLQGLEWPGNVRQLENLCRWLTVMAPGKTFGISDLPDDLRGQLSAKSDHHWEQSLRQWANQELNKEDGKLLQKGSAIFEKALIECALQKTRNNRQNAAKLIGWGRNTLTRKMKELNL